MRKSFVNKPSRDSALEPRWQRFLVHRKTLERMILRAVRSPQDAADMLQELALVLARRVEVPDDDLAFMAWCRAVARHLLLHHFRDARRRPEVLLPFDAPAFQGVRDPSASAERRIALRQLLQGATRSIGESAWELLALRYIDEENSSEIGSRLHEPAVSVRMRLSRLRAQLRRQLVEYEAAPAKPCELESTPADAEQRCGVKRDSDIPPSTVRVREQNADSTSSGCTPAAPKTAAKRERRR